jgi:hypothetical protein
MIPDRWYIVIENQHIMQIVGEYYNKKLASKTYTNLTIGEHLTSHNCDGVSIIEANSSTNRSFRDNRKQDKCINLEEFISITNPSIKDRIKNLKI